MRFNLGKNVILLCHFPFHGKIGISCLLSRAKFDFSFEQTSLIFWRWRWRRWSISWQRLDCKYVFDCDDHFHNNVDIFTQNRFILRFYCHLQFITGLQSVWYSLPLRNVCNKSHSRKPVTAIMLLSFKMHHCSLYIVAKSINSI